MKLWTIALSCALALPACGSSGSDGDPMEVVTVPAAFTVRPGVEIATVIGADPDVPLTLYDAEGTELVTIISDNLGYAHFAYIPTVPATFDSKDGTIPIADGQTLKKGEGYVIRDNSKDPPEASEPFSVMGVHDTPDTALYDGQVINGVTFGILGIPDGSSEADGFNYIEMRDGVKLSAMVRFPDPGLYGDGPYPTLIEYSGYSPSRPNSPEPGSRIATLLGYATVGVNMRGSGCSGGVFDVFNPAQHADGYDIVEAVARQPWVLHNQVGMVGLSYSGIAQLYVGRTNPPSLSAITPLSVIGDAWQQLWPGGIFNDGFTRQWLEERDRQQSSGGQNWTVEQIDAGDTICEEHQDLRGQNVDFQSFFQLLEFYPDDARDRSLPRLIEEIDVPVYLTGAWQDEQTGPQFANMLDRFADRPSNKFTMFNGHHPDGYSPLVLTRWYEFLEFYVAKRVPRISDLVRAVAGDEFSKEFGVMGLGFEPDRFPGFADDDLTGALAAFEAEPKVRVLFENGAGATDAGAPAGRFEASYSTWPPPSAVGRSFYLGPSGSLAAAPGPDGMGAYQHDPNAGSVTFFGPKGYELLVPVWDIDWTEFDEGNLLSYLTEPFTEDTVFAGPGYVELHIESEVDDVNVQVTLTEVRADDIETLVTSGWLRLGHRKIDDAASDEFRIERTFTQEDFAPLVPGEMVAVKIPIPSFAHAFRVGSRLRLIVSTPGRNHGTWQFGDPDYGGSNPTHSVGHGTAMASRVFLPQVSGVTVPAGYPECPSLRGQPCRPYRPAVNSRP